MVDYQWWWCSSWLIGINHHYSCVYICVCIYLYIYIHTCETSWKKMIQIAMARIMQLLGDPTSMHSDWRRQRFCHVCAASWRFDLFNTVCASLRFIALRSMWPVEWGGVPLKSSGKSTSIRLRLSVWRAGCVSMIRSYCDKWRCCSKFNFNAFNIMSKGSLDFLGTFRPTLWIQWDPETTSESWDHRLPGYLVNT
jgi:hypothetical protein